MKLNSKKLGILTQAALASSLCLMPMVGMSAVEVDVAADVTIGAGALADPTDWAKFTKNVTVTTDAVPNNTLGISDGTGIAAGLSAGTDGTGTLGKFILAPDANIPGGLGEVAAKNQLVSITLDGIAGDRTLGGAVFLSGDIKFGGNDQTLNLNNNVTAPNIQFDNKDNAILNLAAGKTIDGAIVSGGADKGTINFLAGAGPSMVTGEIGAADVVHAINVGAVIANFQNHINATNLTVAGVLQMDDGANITGNIDGSGTLDFKGSSDVDGVVTGTSTILVDSVTGGKTVDFKGGDVTATTIQVIGKGLADSTLKFSTLANIVTANITNTKNGWNIVDFTKTTAMNGNVGAAGAEFKQILVVANNNMALNGSVWAQDLNLAGNKVLTVGDNFNINAPVSTAVDGEGTLTFAGNSTTGGNIGAVGKALLAVNIDGAGKTVNVGHDISAKTITLNNTSTLKVTGAQTFTGNLVTAGGDSTLDLGANILNVTGNVTLAANDILRVGVGKGAQGKLVATGNVTTTAGAAGTILNVNNSLGGHIKSASYEVIRGATGGGTLQKIDRIGEIESSAMLSFNTEVKVADGGFDRLMLNVIRKGVDNPAFGLDPQAQSVANALEPAFLAGQLLDINQLLQNMDSDADVKTAMETLVSIDGSAAANAAALGSDNRMDSVQKRIEVARSGAGSYNTGMNAGDSADGIGLWAQLLGNDFTQKKRDSILGYKGNNIGVMFGADTQLDSEWLVGAAFGYGNTDIKYDLAGNTAKVDSWQAMAYASWDFNSPWFAEGMVGYAHHSFDQRRNIILAAQNRTAIADYNAEEWMMDARVGYEYKMDEFMLTPAASLRYSNLSIDDYTETNAGTANLQVKNKDADAFVAGLGLKAEYNMGAFSPDVHFGMYYDFSAKRQETNSVFTGTTVGFMTNGAKPAHDSYEVGVGLNVHATDSLLLNLNYDYDFKSDFHAHAGYLKLKYQW